MPEQIYRYRNDERETAIHPRTASPITPEYLCDFIDTHLFPEMESTYSDHRQFKRVHIPHELRPDFADKSFASVDIYRGQHEFYNIFVQSGLPLRRLAISFENRDGSFQGLRSYSAGVGPSSEAEHHRAYETTRSSNVAVFYAFIWNALSHRDVTLPPTENNFALTALDRIVSIGVSFNNRHPSRRWRH